MKTKHLQILLLALALLASARPVAAQTYNMSRFTIAGGGGTCANGPYTLRGTIGQHDASVPISNGPYSFIGGFWGFRGAPRLPCSLIVTTTADSGPGSLRAAIECANVRPGLDTITFSIPGTGPQTIRPLTPLPAITDPVVIDGLTQPGAMPNSLAVGDNARLLIEIDGSLITTNGQGFVLNAGNSTLRGLVINRFNNAGVGILLASASNVVEGCFVGTEVAGLSALPNSQGIMVEQSPFNRIGGTTPGSRNVISGNQYTGVWIRGQSASGNRVLGNYIGTDAGGRNGLGNGTPLGNGAGVAMTADAGLNFIGGSNPGEGNVISGNYQSNVIIYGSTNTVQGNFVGPDATGTNALGSGYYGIFVRHDQNAFDNIIGGTNAGAGNVISGNPRGINVASGGTSTWIAGNKIGTDLSGQHPLGNAVDGIACEPGSSDTIVGAFDPAAGNIIAYNGRRGVSVAGLSSGNRILGNSIYANARLGIDLSLVFFGNEESDGPTPNDLLDVDSGPNGLQNYPILTSAALIGGNVVINGTLNSNPNGSYRLEFFANAAPDPSGYGEGELFLGFVNATTDAAGNAAFTVSLPAVAAMLHYTATATDSEGNTSEFSPTVGLTSGGAIPCLWNTGVDSSGIPLPDDALELHYFLVQGSPVQGIPFIARAAAGAPIPPWLGDDARSAWIAPTTNTQAGGATDGSAVYRYETVFDLTGFDPSSVVISGRWSTDNGGREILINGISTGPANTVQFSGWTPFHIRGGFVAGLNRLTFLVSNGEGEPIPFGPTGVRVEMSGAGTWNQRLSVAKRGNEVVLNWPGPGFVLQAADVLTGPWEDLSAGASLDGTTFEVTVPPVFPIKFFRLRLDRACATPTSNLLKYAALGGDRSWLGSIVDPNRRVADGRGIVLVATNGAIYSTPEYGAYALGGPILERWQALGAPASWLGYPVSEERPLPTGNGSYVVFEHGFIARPGDGGPPVEHEHDYERIYAALRQQILSRFFALGFPGRRNLLATENRMAGEFSGQPPDRRARWNTASTGGENPHLFGTWLLAMLSVEQAAGNDESTRALRQALETIEELSLGLGDNQIPTRWDAGIPTDDSPDHVQQFIPRDGTVPILELRPDNFHHHPWRHADTLRALMTEPQAAEYEARQQKHVERYRYSEPSMDEVVGMVTSAWLVNKVATDPDLRLRAQRHARRIGEYLASNGYLLVRPTGSMSWRGASGMLPCMEEPIARALADVTGEDYHSRADFQQAMEFAGHWRQLAGPIGAWQALGWTITIAGLAAFPPSQLMAYQIGSLEEMLAGQVLSPSTVAAAIALWAGHSDCLDVQERDELGMAVLAKGAPNKVGLYRAVVTGQALIAPYNAWAASFPGFLCLSGLDHPDPFVRDTFRTWFAIRSGLPKDASRNHASERIGMGASSCWAAAVAAILESQPDAETELMKRLDDAISDMFRTSYFDPQIPVVGAEERLLAFTDTGRYGPLDFCGAMALAWWHAGRRQEASSPVTTPRFPQPLTATTMAAWPRAGVPVDVLDLLLQPARMQATAIQTGGNLVAVGGLYPLFLDPPVPRSQPPVAPIVPADVLIEEKVFFLDPRMRGDLATGITLQPGQALEAVADGDIWDGSLLDGRNSPEGHDRLIDDARWPLHTGLDGGNARGFCLLGRLNGYFFVGSSFSRRKWMYDEPRELFLRINQVDPGGNGGFVVRARVFGPAGSPARPPYHLLRDGGLVLTDEPRDRIFVQVEPGTTDTNAVEFVLETPEEITWRKEVILTSGDTGDPGTWTLWTQDARHRDSNGLWIHQLAGGSIALRRLNPFPGGLTQVREITGLEQAQPGSRITFHWYQD